MFHKFRKWGPSNFPASQPPFILTYLLRHTKLGLILMDSKHSHKTDHDPYESLRRSRNIRIFAEFRMLVVFSYAKL